MQFKSTVLAASLMAIAGLPLGASAQESAAPYTPAGQSATGVLSQSEINDLIAQARASGLAITDDAEVRHVGGSQDAVETTQCCEVVEERVEERNEVQETEVSVEAMTSRIVIQPIRRLLIQPIERRLARGSVETVTEDARVEETRLAVRVERDPVPAVTETVITEETTTTREEVTETTYDVVARRDVIQPVERTVVVPVQRRIDRNRIETVTNAPRYETRTAPRVVDALVMPAVSETVNLETTEETREEVTETMVDFVERRDVIQPVTRVTIQPVERQRLAGTKETVTAPARDVEERLAVRIETDPAPEMQETVIEQVTERTVLEVEDVYVDRVIRQVIQPVIITTVQPVERHVLKATSETVTAPARVEEETLPLRVIDAVIPQTVVNYIPQVTEESREELVETTFEAVTQRDVIQPVRRTLIQPVEIRRANVKTETVTAPTRYETVRASLVVLNVASACGCN